jgi:hypothetical protein
MPLVMTRRTNRNEVLRTFATLSLIRPVMDFKVRRPNAAVLAEASCPIQGNLTPQLPAFALQITPVFALSLPASLKPPRPCATFDRPRNCTK